MITRTPTTQLITDITNNRTSGFRPGVISRFKPGVHEVVLSEYSLTPLHQIDELEEQFTALTPGRVRSFNIYGPNNLCAVHAYGTYLRINSQGYDIALSRRSMRRPDNSNYHIAAALSHIPSVAHPRRCANPDDKVNTLQLTPDSKDCLEAPGVAIYAAPGNGKSYAQQRYAYRCAHTDFMYDPRLLLPREVPLRGFSVTRLKLQRNSCNDYILHQLENANFYPSNGLMEKNRISQAYPYFMMLKYGI